MWDWLVSLRERVKKPAVVKSEPSPSPAKRRRTDHVADAAAPDTASDGIGGGGSTKDAKVIVCEIQQHFFLPDLLNLV